MLDGLDTAVGAGDTLVILPAMAGGQTSARPASGSLRLAAAAAPLAFASKFPCKAKLSRLAERFDRVCMRAQRLLHTWFDVSCIALLALGAVRLRRSSAAASARLRPGTRSRSSRGRRRCPKTTLAVPAPKSTRGRSCPCRSFTTASSVRRPPANGDPWVAGPAGGRRRQRSNPRRDDRARRRLSTTACRRSTRPSVRARRTSPANAPELTG